MQLGWSSIRPRAPWTDTAPVDSWVARTLYAAARVPEGTAVWSTAGALLVVAFIDHLLGARWSLGLLYYLPVAFAAWRLGRDPALIAGIICSSFWVALAAHMSAPGAAELPVLAWGLLTHLGSFSLVAVLVSEMRDLFERERILGRHCHLTGALTGRAFRDVLEETVTAARRRRAGLAMIYVDMDDFKSVNDRLGHAAGDAALEAFARGVGRALMPGDQFARTGGDEFVILMADRGPNARREIDRIRASALASLAESGDVGATMGAIIVPAGRDLEPGDLVRRADAAMYEAKRGGKGSICIFELGERAPLHAAA